MTIRSARVGAVLLAHVQTWRPYTVWYGGLLGLAGAGLVGDGRHWSRLVLAWSAPTLGWIGGHYLGDYFDRRLDAIGKPHRPIPSGRLAPRVALACGVACMLGVAVLAVVGGPGTAIVAGLAVVGIIAYGRLLKARGLSGNLTRGVIGGLAVAFGAVSTGPAAGRALAPVTVLCFALAVWAHDTSSNLVGTLRDMNGDREGGYRTVPVRRGARAAGRLALRFYALFVAAAVVGGLLPVGAAGAPRRAVYFAVLILSLGPGTRAWRSLLAERTGMRVSVALRAHELLVLERIGFCGAIVALGFGAVPAAALVAPMLVATWWTQRRMRAAYELGPARVPAAATAAPAAAPAPAATPVPEPNSI